MSDACVQFLLHKEISLMFCQVQMGVKPLFAAYSKIDVFHFMRCDIQVLLTVHFTCVSTSMYIMMPTGSASS